MHTKQGCKDFEIKNYREYHDMYVQSSTLLLADVFGNFEHVCVEICQLDLAKKKKKKKKKKNAVPGLVWQTASEKKRPK